MHHNGPLTQVSKFMEVPMAMKNDYVTKLSMMQHQWSSLVKTCPVCAQEKLAKEGEETLLLSDESVIKVITSTSPNNGISKEMMVLQHLLEVNKGGVGCWMCFECIHPLEWSTLPKLLLVNNLWIGDIPSVLTRLTIPEQLLIACHYPRCCCFLMTSTMLSIMVVAWLCASPKWAVVVAWCGGYYGDKIGS